MAKETVISFVYDTQLLKREEDDPTTAILYFHPTWVSDQQKTALCGQLMGTHHCIKSVFSRPKILSLQSGKFYLTEYGRYVLALGTDRNISNFILEFRAKMLCSLLGFFHDDLDTVGNIYKTHETFSAKLYHMFETYLKILLYGGNIFSNILTVQIPKSANNVFLEAIQILQTCQEQQNVLGGILLYHNKIVATQLSPDLSKQIVLTDPYRIKSPAEVAEVDFFLPLGIQILQVYIPMKEFEDLSNKSSKFRRIFDTNLIRNYKKPSTKPASVKEPVITAMKRDRSLLFTSVPEEDTDQNLPVNIENTFINKKYQNRPKTLSLKTNINEEVKTEANPTISTPYLGHTSVASTPMADLKRVLHFGTQNICGAPEKDNSLKEVSDSFKTESINSILSAVSEDSNSQTNFSNRLLFSTAPYVTVTSNPFDSKKSTSMWDVRERIRSFAKRFVKKFGSPREEQQKKKHVMWKTISDPTFPVFRSDGMMISQSLYESYVEMQMKEISRDIKNEEYVSKILEDFDTDFRVDVKVEKKKDVELQEFITEKSKKTKRSLSLPLKSLTSGEGDFSSKLKSGGGVQLTPLLSKLSILASDDKSSGFYSTPSDSKDFSTLSSSYNLNLKKITTETTTSMNALKKCFLFVCGQQDTVVNVLLEERSLSSEVIQRLWDICTENLGKLERQLQHCLESCPANNSHSDSETYSYLCMDNKWGTTKRGGPWGTQDLDVLSDVHIDFVRNPNLTEIILRPEESIIYGHHLAGNEVYYHQHAQMVAGLPTPADPMGSVPLKAKRRLERDQNITLL